MAVDWGRRQLDPITMELLRNSLQSIVDEAAVTLEQTCASQLVRDAQDFSVGLCEPAGELIGVSITAPSQIGVIPAVMSRVLEHCGGDIYAGDVFIVNDPYHGGTHLNDLHLLKPVFFEDSLLAFATSKAHHTDVGGRVSGSMSFDNTEIYQEGIRLAPLKLYERGTPNAALFAVLELNVRYPEMLLGDLEAQSAALGIAERGVLDLYATYGPQLAAYFSGLLDYGEAMARARIASWPDGSAEFEDHCDDDGVTGEPVTIRCRVEVSGEEVLIDFTGTSSQVAAAVNFPPFESASRTQLVLRCCLGPGVPDNGGVIRTLTVRVPEGTLLNPRPPAPCSERGLVTYRVGDTVFGAFAGFCPEGVTAAGEGGSYFMRFSGEDAAGTPFFCADLVQGTWGARAERDGVDALANIQANHTNTPVEVVEANFPVRVETHALIPDSGGRGRNRGGMALERSWRYLGGRSGVLRSRADRRRFPPYGLFGGQPGAASELWLEREGEAPRSLPGKAVVELRPADLVRLRTAGGGGWGPPEERDRELVQMDLREGKVTVW